MTYRRRALLTALLAPLLAACSPQEIATMATIIAAADGKVPGSAGGAPATGSGGPITGGGSAGGIGGARTGGSDSPPDFSMPPERADDIDRALRMLNDARSAARLPPVTLDAEMSRGCSLHIEYLWLNRNHPSTSGLGAHKEDPTLPGYTPEGQKAGESADIGFVPPPNAMAAFLASLYHRTPAMHPRVNKVGIATKRYSPQTMYTLVMFAFEGSAGPDAFPVAYPADGQRGLPRKMGPEYPNPVPGGNPLNAGYPISLGFEDDQVDDVRVTLTDGAGAAVPFHLSTPKQPATSFPQGGVVSIIPKRHLAHATTYKVAVEASVKGAPRSWSWSFTTATPEEEKAQPSPIGMELPEDLLGQLGDPNDEYEPGHGTDDVIFDENEPIED